MFVPGLVFLLESSVWHPGIPAMSGPSAKVFQNFESTTDPVTGCISSISQGPLIVVLLAGGDKRTQVRDVRTALDLARNL